MTLPALLMAGALGAACSSAGPASNSSSPLSAPQIVAAARVAALARGTVQAVIVTDTQGHTIVFDNDSARNGGLQLIVEGDSKAEIILIDQVAFLRAGASALNTVFGLSSQQADAGAGRWIAVTPNDAQWTSISAGITLGSVLGEVLPGGHLTKEGTETLSGQKVVVVGGALAGSTVRLDVAARGSPLPLREVSAGQGVTQTVGLSHWGVPVHLSPPNGAVPLDALGS